MKFITLQIGAACILAFTGSLIPAETAFAQDEDSYALEEIVVSARKREERLVDVPVSATVISGDVLIQKGIENVEDLIGTTPGLYFSSNLLSPGRDFLSLVVRGVGSFNPNEPAVATVIDGAYSPSLGFDIGFLDLERIELLRGPQGTLFGRNTQGGVLNIITRKPDDEFRAKVLFEVDDMPSQKASLAVSGPLSEHWFAGASVNFTTTDGYLDNPVIANTIITSSGQTPSTRSAQEVDADAWDKLSGRVALRYLNDNWDINLSLDSSVRTGLDGLPGVLRGCNCYDITSEVQYDGRYENTGGILAIEYGGDNYTFTSITNVRDLSSKLPFDFDGTDFFTNNTHDLQTEQDIFSQELRVDYVGERFDWLVGAYVFEEEHFQDRGYFFDTSPDFPDLAIFLQDQRIERDGWAIFAHGKARFGAEDDWELSAGIRASSEEATSMHALGFTSAFPPPFDNFVDIDVLKTLESDAVSPSISLAYSLGDSSTAYVTWSEGFKAGGFPKAAAGSSTNLAFDDETSTNIEFGYKTVALNNRLAVDFSIFTIDIEDQQLSSIAFLNGDPNVPIATVTNAGSSTSSGFDLAVTGLITENFEMTANIGFTDTEYDVYVDADGDDRAGQQFPFVPELTYNITGKYTMPVFSNAELALRADYRYVDDTVSGAGVGIDVAYTVPSWNRLDLDATLSWDTWDLTFYINNATDEYIETRAFNSFFFSVNPFFTPAEGLPHSIIAAPRVVGLRVIKSF